MEERRQQRPAPSMGIQLVSGGVCASCVLSSISSDSHTSPPFPPFPRSMVEPYTFMEERHDLDVLHLSMGIQLV